MHRKEFLASAAALAASSALPASAESLPHARVTLGDEAFLQDEWRALNGRSAGVITNQTGVTSRLESIVDAIRRAGRVQRQGNLCAGTRFPRRPPGRLVRCDVYRSAERLAGLQPVRRHAPPQRRDARRRRRAAVRHPRRRLARIHVHFDDGLRDAEREAVRQGVLGAGPAEPDRRHDRRRAGAWSPPSNRSSASIRSRCATA